MPSLCVCVFYVWFSFSFTFAPKSYVCWFFPNTRVFLFFLMHIVVSLIFFIYVRFDSISAFKRSPPLFVLLLNRVTIARLLLLLLCKHNPCVVFPCVLFWRFSFFNRGTHSTGFSLLSVKGTKYETRSLFSSLCVFHFIIMQKIYYIRVVFVCLLLLVSLAFSRRYKFVNKKILKRKKHNIMCLWGGKFLLLSRTAADTKREGWLFCDLLLLRSFLFLYHRHVKRNYLTLKRVENSQLPEFDLSLSCSLYL